MDNVNYWLGPYDIRVPNNVTSITDSDGCNTLYKDGGFTEMYNPNPPTEAQYKEKYCILLDGIYYYKERK
jgi:hypothetical protein